MSNGEDVKVLGMAPETGRWIFVLAGMIMNLCLGAIYAYSVVRVPLEAYYKSIGVVTTATNMLYPFIVFLAVFAITMPLAGPYIGKMGPRKVALIGGVLTGLGWFAASTVANPSSLALAYGIIGGLGVGIAYGVPIQVSSRWFPDRRGLAVGLTVLGFGFSAALIAPISDFLVKNYGGIINTFRIFGIGFLIILVLLALLMTFPPAGWVPRGWKPPEPKAGAAPKAEFMREEMVKTTTFYGLWICYTIGTLAGLMAIGVSKPVGLEVAGKLGMDALAASALMTSLVIPFAACNGGGRPVFGWLTDKLTPRNAAFLDLGLIIVATLILYLSPASIAVYTLGFAILWGCLGGWLAIAPTATASFFGIKDNARNYGLVFTAYGAGAIIGSLLAGRVKDMFGAYDNVFLIVAALAALGVIVAFIWLKPPVKKGAAASKSA